LVGDKHILVASAYLPPSREREVRWGKKKFEKTIQIQKLMQKEVLYGRRRIWHI